jgi:hypothetical protein
MATQSRANNPHVMLAAEFFAPSTQPALSLWGGAMRCQGVSWRELPLVAHALLRAASTLVSTLGLSH